MQKQNTGLLKKTLQHLVFFTCALLVLSLAIFTLARMAPGDPLQAFYGDALDMMPQQEQDAARARLGLDRSLPIQYEHWLSNALQGDFGISLKYKTPVMNVVRPLLGNTLLLGGLAYILVFGLAILLAIICALHEDEWQDKLFCRLGTLVYYIPSFWLGILLVLIFSINLGWLPSSGAYDIGKAGDIGNRVKHLILPLVVMLTSHVGYYAYLIRNKLLDELREDYVLLAKSKGLTNSEIIRKHCLRNVAPTIVNIMAIAVPHITGGTVVVESVFAYPGIGNLAVESAKYHDYNLLMLTVLITGIVVLLSSFIAQLITEKIDPRMKATEVIKW